MVQGNSKSRKSSLLNQKWFYIAIFELFFWFGILGTFDVSSERTI